MRTLKKEDIMSAASIIENLKKEKTLIFLIIFVIYFSFSNASNWFADGCIVTSADFESHRTMSNMLQEQLTTYGWLYPINF